MFLSLPTIVTTFITLIALTSQQLARDIALKYLYLDIDGDNLLSHQQLYPVVSRESPPIDPTYRPYYHWSQYLYKIYAHQVFSKYDLNGDGVIGFVELAEAVSRVKRATRSWPKGYKNVLLVLKTEDYMLICDEDKSQSLNRKQFKNCMRGVLMYQSLNYPYKIKSKLYPNKTIGYSYQQFLHLLPKPRSPSSSPSQCQATHQLSHLFHTFQWPQQKIPQDTDKLIGPQQGKFMQPTILYFYLDTNWDEVLDRSEIIRYLNRFGNGDEAFGIADVTGDGLLDQAEFIAYFLFAGCVEDCDGDGQGNGIQGCGLEQDEATFKLTEKACGILEQIIQSYKQSQIQTPKVQEHFNSQVESVSTAQQFNFNQHLDSIENNDKQKVKVKNQVKYSGTAQSEPLNGESQKGSMTTKMGNKQLDSQQQL